MPGTPLGTNKPYIRIVAGNLVQTVSKDTPGARFREYEQTDGNMGSKWELVYMNWEGIIQNITFKKTNYGDECHVEFEDVILSIPTAGRYFSDFASKIMGADLSKPILIHPYSFNDTDKNRTGVVLVQDKVKLKSYYWDGEKKLNGFPEVDESRKEKKTYWKVYFAEVEEFLIDKLKTLSFQPKIVDEAYEPSVENFDEFLATPNNE